MKEWFCEKCHSVFGAGVFYAKCCGEIEEFSPEKHGKKLVSASNSWISVWKMWGDHPLTKDVSEKLYQDGCWGAATHHNRFVQSLIDELEDLKRT